MRRLILECCAAALLTPAGAAWAQMSFLGPFTGDVSSPAGVKVNRLSVYLGGYEIGVPQDTPGVSSPGKMLVGGASSEFGWYLTRRTTQFFADYVVAYNGNTQFSNLNGFDHILSFGLQAKIAPRVTLVLDGAGESTTFGEFLYLPTQSAATAGQSGTPEQLGGALTGSTVIPGVTNSPLSLALYGGRRRDFSGGARLVVVATPRLTWNVSVRGVRDLPSVVGGPGSSPSIPYGGVTEGMAAWGFTYTLSRRTTVGADLSYARSYWGAHNVQIASGTVALTRVLAPRWFATLDAGYGAMAETEAGVRGPFRGQYVGGASLGATLRNNTFVITGHRAASDNYGLGAFSTTEGQLAWDWHSTNRAWSVRASAAYQRLTGQGVGPIAGWMYLAGLTRRLSRNLTLVAEAVYATETGLTTGGIGDLTRRGVRLSLTWTPTERGR
jgi:hypothetical protein